MFQSFLKSPGRSESIDVDKLNQLIRALDKTWILPRPGAKDPVGSNFQYKKTCASIFKARHGACQQLGFGVMCFNYCYERGEQLSFKCQDASDATYCRQSGTFETFIAKYRKDGYKAKAYVHQMISRCYATAICNTQTGILNSTIISEEEHVETTTRVRILLYNSILCPHHIVCMEWFCVQVLHLPLSIMNRLRLLTRAAKPSKSRTTATTAAPEENDYDEEKVTISTTTRRRSSDKRKSTRSTLTTVAPPVAVTSSKSNIWDRFTVGQNSKVSQKYVPFWKRLLSTTIRPPEIPDNAEESVEIEVRNTQTEELFKLACRVAVYNSARVARSKTVCEGLIPC
ncbi:unnamed protein product [Heligmosomoides polygyrus]|uniref:WSC domain-containing protein n=1 Tax=Heligmosomoides polygyrus TaxID=6339 RepID=A0A183G064_HELPZ|nr:unnamed protein product [Heligmosomoides polygyrus]